MCNKKIKENKKEFFRNKKKIKIYCKKKES